MTYELVAIVHYCEELVLMYGHLDFKIECDAYENKR